MIDDLFSNPDSIYAAYQDLRRQYLNTIDDLDAASQVSQNAPIAPEIFGGGGGGGGFGGPCFAGEIRVPMFDGTDYAISHIYHHRKRFVGKMAKSFNSRNQILPGEILHVRKSTIYEILSVQFKCEKNPMRMNPAHRFWTAWYEFESMSSLPKSTKVFNHEKDWGYSSVELKERIKIPEGIDVYNLSIKNYHAYFAFAPGGKQKAVSNLKPPPGDLPN